MVKSQAERRHEAFVEAGEAAKAHCQEALGDIDAVLAEQDRIMSGIGWMASKGWLDQEAAEEAIRAYHDDPLAEPLTNVTDWPH